MRIHYQEALVGRRFWSATAALRRGGVTVLVYHRIGKAGTRFSHTPFDVFAQQMRWLRANCRIIHPDDFEARVTEPARAGQVQVMVTFDDGYRDYHDLAYPILRELGIVAVNFLSTRHVDEPVPFWWDVLEMAALTTTRRHASHPRSNRQILLDEPGRARYVRAWKRVLKCVADPDRSSLLERALADIGIASSALSVPRQVMNWDEVRATSEGTVFGGHGHAHTALPLLSAPDMNSTIETCRMRITKETQRRPHLFAYPNGASCTDSRAAVAQAGFKVAFGKADGFVSHPLDWANVPRMAAPSSLANLAWLLSGWSQTPILRQAVAATRYARQPWQRLFGDRVH